MEKQIRDHSRFNNLKIAITGASGSLGKSLTKELRNKGAFVIGLTHRKTSKENATIDSPQEWITWSCGKESSLIKVLSDVDILILNHGVYPKGLPTTKNINIALEVNALSTWKLMQVFEDIALDKPDNLQKKEVWINTSEAEIQIALSPLYEISKHLIGEIVSIKKNSLQKGQADLISMKKLVLGPFKSDLNPVGIMSSDDVARKIINKAQTNSFLIIVSPNPLTHLLMPLTEKLRSIYCRLTTKLWPQGNH